MIQSICVTIDTVTISLIMFSMFSVYSNTPGAQITPRKVFIAFSFISYFRMTLLQTAISVLQQAAAVVAGRRIKVELNVYILILTIESLEFPIT